MKGICIAGGGADGAITVGRLIGLGNPKFDYFNGISTGALIVFPYALGLHNELKESFICDDKEIYNKKAFGKNSKFMKYLVDSMIKGRLSVGESIPLREKIYKTINDKRIDIARLEKLKVEVGVLVDSTLEVEWTDIHSDEFRQMVWASTSVPFVMSNPFDKKGRSLSDGGVVEGVGLERAIIQGCTDIDVFMHYPKSKKFHDRTISLGLADNSSFYEVEKDLKEPKNKIEKIKLIWMSVFRDSNDSSLLLGLLLAKTKGVNVRVHWLRSELDGSSMDFSIDKSNKLINEGLELAKDDRFTDIYNFKNC